MRKELAVALPLALGVPFAAHASCTTYNTDSGAASISCSTTQLDNLRSGVTLQASAGVALTANDGDDAGLSGMANDIAVVTCHDSGNAGFFGDTGGGSVQKNDNYDAANNCTSAPNITAIYNT